jgi:hypothetical protein
MLHSSAVYIAKRAVCTSVAVCALSVGVAVSVGVTATAAAIAPDLPEPFEGSLTVLDETGRRSITTGDASTPFRIQLDDPRECPGDSANDQWRVQSFMVPESTNLFALDFGVVGPEDEGEWALFGADSAARTYANVLTQANTAAGRPGTIADPPVFSFAVIPADGVRAGLYRIGLSCTFFGEVNRVWSTQIEVTDLRADTDQTAQFTWQVTQQQRTVSPPSSLRRVVLGAVVAGCASLIAISFFDRRKRSARPRATAGQKES